MEYNVKLTPTAEEDLKAFNKELQKRFIKKIEKQARQSTLAEITELVKGTNKEWEIILVKGYLGDFMEMIKRRNRFFGWDNRGIVDEAQKMTFKVIDKLTDTLLTKLKDK